MPRIVDVEQRRSELTEAAARVIARSGLEAATMREVAAEAGWTTGALTHYFADKRELLLTTFQASLARRRARRPALEAADPADRLWASLEGALPLDDERRRHWMVTIACASQAAGDDALATAQRDAYREFRSHVAGLVIEAGHGTGRAAASLGERLIAAADGIAIQAIFDHESWSPARQRAVLRITVDALLAA